MEAITSWSWKFQLNLISILFLWFSGTWSNAYHLEKTSQKENVTQINKQLAVRQTFPSSASKQVTSKNIPPTQITSAKSLGQLQLEIQELLRMQKQLTAEIVSGKDNTKKRTLLKHIKTQLHLRKMQQKGKQQQQQQIPLKKQSKVLQPVENQKNLQQSKFTLKQQKIKMQDISAIRLKKQNQQIHQHKQKQEHKILHTKSNNLITAYKSARIDSSIGTGALGIIPSPHLNYENVNAVNSNLGQQQLLKPQMMSHPMLQHRSPIKLNHRTGLDSPQFRTVNQQDLSKNQIGTPQHILVPINALALNSMVPRNVLPQERYIVVDAAIQDNGQTQAKEKPSIIKTTVTKLQQKTTPKPPTITTQTQKTTRTTTPMPRTTHVSSPPTTPWTTFVPSPPTTDSFVYETTPVGVDTLKKEFYRGEIQKQRLEVRKLRLEIRALQRKEMMGGMPRGETENDDAPQRRQRLRFNPRMPFPFF